MKVLKNILKVIGIVIVALIIVSFFLPNKSHVERTTTMKADVSTVYNLVNDLKKWELWSPWHKLDPKMKLEYSAATEGKGAWYKWQSENKNVGNGSMTIIDSKTNEEILTQMHFGDMGNPNATFEFEKNGDGTKVTWTFDGNSDEVPFYMRPMCKYMSLMMDKFIGPDYEKGLKNLDSVSSAMPKSIAGKVVSVEEVNVPEKNCITLEGDCDVKDIAKTLGMMYGKIGQKMAENKLKMAGAPCAMYPGFDGKATHTKIVACVVTDKLCKAKCDAGMTFKVCKASKCVKAEYMGAYEGSGIAYEAIKNWAKENKKELIDQPWEEYANDPTTVKSPAEYLTNVYWMVK